MFLYSKTDFYLPWQHLEKEVLSVREAQGGRDFRTVRWDKSPHVGHLRNYKQQYSGHVLNFLYDKYFSKATDQDCLEEKKSQKQEADARGMPTGRKSHG